MALLAASTLLAGCYGAAPGRVETLLLPDRVRGGRIDVRSQSTTEWEDVAKRSVTCPAGHSEGSTACLVTNYTVKEPVTRTTSVATYAGRPITYGQFLVMTDPDYDEKLKLLTVHSDACQFANTPRYIGLGATIGGLVLYGIAGSRQNSGLATVGLLALGGGAVSYATGYFAFGGSRCNAANSLHYQLDMSHEAGITTVYGRAVEMDEAAGMFNAGAK